MLDLAATDASVELGDRKSVANEDALHRRFEHGVGGLGVEGPVVDGASRWQMMWKITIPSILPTIIIMLIIRIGNILEVSFEMIILLYQPATYETADVVNTFIYRQGLQGGQYDFAAAAGLFNAIVAFVLVMTANTISKRYSRTSLW